MYFQSGHHVISLVIVIIIVTECSSSPSKFTLAGIVNLPFPAYNSAAQLAIDDINNDQQLLPNTKVFLDKEILPTAPPIITKMIAYNEQNTTLIVGNEYSAVATVTGIAGKVYEIAQLSGLVVSSLLSDKTTYPYFSRISANGDGQMLAMLDGLRYYSSIGGKGWTDVAIIIPTNEYGIGLSKTFINNAGNDISVVTFQQFLDGTSEFSLEFDEVKKSGARVIATFLYAPIWADFISTANEKGLVGDQYVWFTSSALVGAPIFPDQEKEILELSRGLIGMFEYIPRSGVIYDSFVERWLSLDKTLYPGSETIPTSYTLLAYDVFYIAGLAIDRVDKMGMLDLDRVPAELWTQVLRNTTLDGVTGMISLNEFGDRDAIFSHNFFDPETKSWVISSTWSPSEGFTPLVDVVWNSNSTKIPDLDVRAPFYYWSCEDKEEGFDPTGKEISLHTPDTSDVDEIDIDYHCDTFIDCRNMSDESKDCSSNYVILFIVFGVITIVLISISVILLIFVLIFGLILKYQRLRVASPFFLILMLISIIVGYASIFTWFGKPHPVACGFQPWMLGLSAISMITTLCVKTFRIWRIFRSELKRQKITDFELLILWSVIMIPAVIIVTVWTIVSTPTADIRKRDGEYYWRIHWRTRGIHIFWNTRCVWCCCIIIRCVFIYRNKKSSIVI